MSAHPHARRGRHLASWLGLPAVLAVAVWAFSETPAPAHHSPLAAHDEAGGGATRSVLLHALGMPGGMPGASPFAAPSLYRIGGPVRPAFAGEQPPTPLLPGHASALGVEDSTFDGVDYSDPTGSGTPLVWAGPGAPTRLSASFRLTDFASPDGAPLLRVSGALVDALERLRAHAGPFSIVSGYRHPAYNATVGGIGDSQHTAGRAADLWSPTHPPLELAREALAVLGCQLGLGLGPHTLHLDVRGELTTWTYADAPLSEAAFDAWALVQCGRPVPPQVLAEAERAWLAPVSAPSMPATEADAPLPTAADATDASPPEALLKQHGAAVLETLRATSRPGILLLDFRDRDVPLVRIVAPADTALAGLDFDLLLSWCAARPEARYVPYAIISGSGRVRAGVTNLGASGGRPSFRP